MSGFFCGAGILPAVKLYSVFTVPDVDTGPEVRRLVRRSPFWAKAEALLGEGGAKAEPPYYLRCFDLRAQSGRFPPERRPNLWPGREKKFCIFRGNFCAHGQTCARKKTSPRMKAPAHIQRAARKQTRILHIQTERHQLLGSLPVWTALPARSNTFQSLLG